jgi:uncharacterized phage protein (TIGR01671 family)
MREIRFRAFGKSGKMHYWSLTDCQSGWVTPDEQISDIMQSTGLKDKNGVELYESDIVTIPEARRNYTVEFDDFGFKLIHADPVLNRMVWGGLHKIDEVGFTIEVIGNIYQHPELLKT